LEAGDDLGPAGAVCEQSVYEHQFFVFSDVWALTTRLSTGNMATAAAAPINVRRFIMVSN
jgi:hypothetical protein